jgi:hypothetical protein
MDDELKRNYNDFMMMLLYEIRYEMKICNCLGIID